jgi:hypothetical protein
MEALVGSFLRDRGFGPYAAHICAAFRGAQYPESDWLLALEAMPPQALHELVQAAANEIGTTPS